MQCQGEHTLPCPTCDTHHRDDVSFNDVLGNLLTLLNRMENDDSYSKKDAIVSTRNNMHILMRMMLTSHMNVHLAMNTIDPAHPHP